MMSRPEGRLSAATGPQNQGGEERSSSQVGDFSEDFIMLSSQQPDAFAVSLIKSIFTHITFLLAVLAL